MSRHSSRLAIQSRPTPRSGRFFTAAYAGAALIAPRSRPSHWKSVLRALRSPVTPNLGKEAGEAKGERSNRYRPTLPQSDVGQLSAGEG